MYRLCILNFFSKIQNIGRWFILASGHIDPDLNNENVWHSVLTLLLAALHSAGGTLCAVVDYLQPNSEGIVNERESKFILK